MDSADAKNIANCAQTVDSRKKKNRGPSDARFNYPAKKCTLRGCKNMISRAGPYDGRMPIYQYKAKLFCSSKCRGADAKMKNIKAGRITLTGPRNPSVTTLTRALQKMKLEVKEIKKALNLEENKRTQNGILALAKCNQISILREAVLTESMRVAHKATPSLKWDMVHAVLDMYTNNHDWWYIKKEWSIERWIGFIGTKLERERCEE